MTDTTELGAYCAEKATVYGDNASIRIVKGWLEERDRLRTPDRNKADYYKAELAHVSRLALKFRYTLAAVVEEASDEGDRAYFGSMNHLDRLRDISDAIYGYSFERRITAGAALPDLYAEMRGLRDKIEALEAQAAADKARVGVLEDAIDAAYCYVVNATTDTRYSPAGREEAERRLAILNAAHPTPRKPGGGEGRG